MERRATEGAAGDDYKKEKERGKKKAAMEGGGMWEDVSCN